MLRSLNREIGIYGIVLLGFYLRVLSVRAWVIWWAGPGPGLGGVHREEITIVMGHGAPYGGHGGLFHNIIVTIIVLLTQRALASYHCVSMCWQYHWNGSLITRGGSIESSQF